MIKGTDVITNGGIPVFAVCSFVYIPTERYVAFPSSPSDGYARKRKKSGHTRTGAGSETETGQQRLVKWAAKSIQRRYRG